MIEVLVYLFENYYPAECYPDHDTLTRKLHAAGFENEDISVALNWLNGLAQWRAHRLPEYLEKSSSPRIYVAGELDKLSAEGRGFLCFLESAKVLSPLLRELIIERAMAVEEETIEIDKLKIIVLIVLWTHRGNVDALILDELMANGRTQQIH